MFLSKREYFNSQVYSKWRFIKKEVIPITIFYTCINLIIKIIEFNNSHLMFKFNIFFIFVLSSFCIFFSMFISSYIRYDIYKDVHNKLGFFSYFLYNFVCVFLILLGSLVLRFDTNPKKAIVLIITSFILSSIYSIFSSYFSYRLWNKNLSIVCVVTK